jgi:hypothetical protein
MKNHPVFVPHDGGSLAAVVTLPDGAPHGVVFLLLHFSQLDLVGSGAWAWAAQLLAERGLASIRLDYGSLGDSTGLADGYGFEDVPENAEQVRAVLRAVRGDAELPFGAVGWCHDGLVALELTRDPSCVGAVCLNTPLTRPSKLTETRRRLGGMPLVGLVRSSGTLRRILFYDRVRAMLRDRPDPLLRQSIEAAVDGERVLFLHNASLWAAEEFSDDATVHRRNDLETTINPHVERDHLTLAEEVSLAKMVDWLGERFGDAPMAEAVPETPAAPEVGAVPQA